MKTIEERIQEYVANAWVELDQFNEDHVTFGDFYKLNP